MDIERVAHPSFSLTDGNIEVWSFGTQAPEHLIRQLESRLSADERVRAARLHFESDRNTFIIARSALRTMLARYLGTSSSDVAFLYGPKGKPSLPDSSIDFNVSHTNGVVALAFTSGCALGVDVECIRPVQDMMQIARQFFCPAEAEQLAGLSEEQRHRAFFVCWTRKEAYIKATGNGLSTPLTDFQVTLKQAEPARFIRIGSCLSPSWVLHDIDISPAYAAAIAYDGPPKCIVRSPILPTTQLVDFCKR